MDLGSAFAAAVRRQPAAEAIVDGERRRRYGEWEGEIRAAAGGLVAMGLKAGDHVVAVMRNRWEMATLYWACQFAGLVFTPVSWRAGEDEIGYCLEDAEARLVVHDGAAGDAAAQAAARRGIATIVAADGKGDGGRFESLFAAAPLGRPTVPPDDATCLMLYTSGTTGRPKGVPRSHRAELAAAVSHIAHNQYRHGESALGVMPLFHTMGVRSMLCAALLNGKLVAVPDYSPGEVLRLIAEERVSSLFLVPTMYHDVLREADFRRFDLGSLSRIGYAGMGMAPALTERCRAALRPDLFVNYYGSSEIYSFTYCDHLDRKPGSAGRAGLNQIVRVVPAEPGPVPDDGDLAPGEPGEIVASMASPEAFAGYWKRPDADAKAIQGRWYRTGDLGHKDGDGELYVIGRVDDMIISGGENIYPEEVEDALLRSGLCGGVAVIGLPDERLGNRVVAFVELGAAAPDRDALDRACLKSGLARFKRPRDYVFVRAIPRSASGKLLRRLLRSGQYQRIG